MLRSLQIRDFVIVDRLELEFEAGFGALTGETGAGKSILLDALSLVLGARGDAGMIREACERAELSAEFDLPADAETREWLEQQQIDVEDGVLVLRRVIDRGGRSRAWVNGTSATLAQLRLLGDGLADIHGQHAHHALLRGETQRRMLDVLGGAEATAHEVAAAWAAWQRAIEALARAEHDSAHIARERELMGWRLEELRGLAFDSAEWASLEQDQSRLAHAAHLLEGAQQARDALTQVEPGLVDQLERHAARLSSLAEFDAELGEYAELLQTAAIQASEAALGLGRYAERLDIDPGRLAAIDERIARITGIARKYRVEPDALPELLAATEAEDQRLQAATDLAALRIEEQAQAGRFREAATRLSAARRQAAAALGREVSEAMQSLAMGGGRFEVMLEPAPEGSAHGLERVEFRVAGGVGQPLRPLGKVASGGELSRIGLAIQVIASRDGGTPTLIFDEVDVGVGGRVAEIVGQMLGRLGADRQVLCVTHLPQVAAQADWQWTISKEVHDGATLSRVRELDDEGRIDEIARMLGGVLITETTREHACEMLGLRDRALVNPPAGAGSPS
ncbi:MAG: DNA repair protein RecN [Rhodocyclaceae bacterium]|nr:DNA repair protein RecN [Rhodocyclaceae bacterium]